MTKPMNIKKNNLFRCLAAITLIFIINITYADYVFHPQNFKITSWNKGKLIGEEYSFYGLGYCNEDSDIKIGTRFFYYPLIDNSHDTNGYANLYASNYPDAVSCRTDIYYEITDLKEATQKDKVAYKLPQMCMFKFNIYCAEY